MADKDFRSNLDDPDVLSAYASAASPLSINDLLKARAVSQPVRADLMGAGLGATATPSTDETVAPANNPVAQPVQPSATAASTPPSARDMVMSGMTTLKSNLQSATQATDEIPTTNPELEKWNREVTAKSQPTQLRQYTKPDETGEGTGAMLPQYKEGLGKKILRGVRGAAVGFLTGGIPGAALGAIEPQDIAGGTAYGAPNRLYNQTEAARQNELAGAEKSQADTLADWKEQVDARKARAEQFSKTAELGGKLATAGNDVMRNDVQEAKNANETPDAKAQAAAKTKQLEDAQQFQERQDHLDALARRKTKLSPSQQARYLLTGQMADPRQATEGEIELGNAMAAFRRDKKRAPNYQEYMQMVQGLHGRGGAIEEGGGRAPAEQAMIDSANDELTKFKSDYQWNPTRKVWHKKGDTGEREPLLPEQYTARKNEIIGKLNKSLAAKKFAPLQLQFDPQSDIQRDSGMQATAPSQPAVASTSAAPTRTPPAGATHTAISKVDGKLHYTNEAGTIDLGVAQ